MSTVIDFAGFTSGIESARRSFFDAQIPFFNAVEKYLDNRTAERVVSLDELHDLEPCSDKRDALGSGRASAANLREEPGFLFAEFNHARVHALQVFEDRLRVLALEHKSSPSALVQLPNTADTSSRTVGDTGDSVSTDFFPSQSSSAAAAEGSGYFSAAAPPTAPGHSTPQE